jgi:GNAT superfamily N-acetyltransferase
MRVTKATVKDCKEILRLWKQFMDYCSHLDEFSSLGKESERTFYNHLLGSVCKPDSAIFVAKDSKMIVGYIKASKSFRSPVYETVEIGEISDIFVLPEYRKLGVGKLLVSRVEKWFENKGLDLFWVRVHSANELGNSFWKALKYRGYMIERVKRRNMDESQQP